MQTSFSSTLPSQIKQKGSSSQNLSVSQDPSEPFISFVLHRLTTGPTPSFRGLVCLDPS